MTFYHRSHSKYTCGQKLCIVRYYHFFDFENKTVFNINFDCTYNNDQSYVCNIFCFCSLFFFAPNIHVTFSSSKFRVVLSKSISKPIMPKGKRIFDPPAFSFFVFFSMLFFFCSCVKLNFSPFVLFSPG